MAWTIEWDKRAAKELKKLSKPTQHEILTYLNKIAASDDPRRFGKALRYNLKGLWRYRIAGVYRVVCQLEDDRCTIFVVRASHRRHVYA